MVQIRLINGASKIRFFIKSIIFYIFFCADPVEVAQEAQEQRNLPVLIGASVAGLVILAAVISLCVYNQRIKKRTKVGPSETGHYEMHPSKVHSPDDINHPVRDL